MKTCKLLIAAAVFALAGGAAFPADRKAENEARLARMLEGRTAGEPVACIPVFKPANRLAEIEGVALVYDAGDVIYVARPAEPDSLNVNDIMVLDRTGSQLCNTDAVRTVDRVDGRLTGLIFLSKFVPYAKQN